MQIYQAEVRHTERKFRLIRRGSKAHGKEMQLLQAEARHAERKCRFSKRKQGTRRGKVDVAGGSKAHGEEMQS